jgi:hypothetical protein
MNPDQTVSHESVDETVVLEVESDPDDILLLDEVIDSELILPVWEATGNVEIDSALEKIQTIDLEDIHSHHGILTDVHDRLQDIMVNLER